MFHKVKSVECLPGFRLCVRFCEGVTKSYDVTPLAEKYSMFSALRDCPEIFGTAKVDVGGYGVIWGDELDISCNELWANGEKFTGE